MYFRSDTPNEFSLQGYEVAGIRQYSSAIKLNEILGYEGNGWLELRTTDGRYFEEVFDEHFQIDLSRDADGNGLVDIVDELSKKASAIVFCYGECDRELELVSSLGEFRSRVEKGLSEYPVELHLGFVQKSQRLLPD